MPAVKQFMDMELNRIKEAENNDEINKTKGVPEKKEEEEEEEVVLNL